MGYLRRRAGRSPQEDKERAWSTLMQIDELFARAKTNFSTGHWSAAAADFRAIRRMLDAVIRVADRGDQ